MVYLRSVENVTTLGKLIGLLFLFCLPPHPPPLYFVLKTRRNDLARPVMGTIFLVIYVVGMSRMSNHVESRESNARMLKVSIGW